MKNYNHIIEHIKKSHRKPHIYLACTGAGPNLLSQLWQIPGASSFLIGSSFTYASHETDEFIGYKPKGYCTEETAMEMAMASYIRACEYEMLNDDPGFPIGVGLSASVASTRVHRGEHRAFFAFMTNSGMFCFKDVFKKDMGADARRTDDNQCTATATFLINRILQDNFTEYLVNRTCEAEELLFKRPLFAVDGRRLEAPKSATFLPGAFNPIHDGHRGMLAAVEIEYGLKPMYAITVSSIHKPNIDLETILQRAAMLRLEKWNHETKPFIFTKNDPLFIDKARQFPGSSFIVGADAAMKIFDPKWDSDVPRTLKEFKDLQTRFYVFPRMVDGEYIDFAYIEDNHYQTIGLFKGMSGQWDISSTEFRNG